MADIRGCNDKCGCMVPCPGGEACRCETTMRRAGDEGRHNVCTCGDHCSCNPCTCGGPGSNMGVGRAACTCRASCKCTSCAT